MGAWGTDSFENDEACDWAADFLRKKDGKIIKKTLQRVVKNDDFIESDEGAAAIAAAEVVARLKGNFGQRDAYTADLDAWISSGDLTISEETEELALRALKQITGKQSELREIWEDAGKQALRDWLAKVEELRTRIAAQTREK